MQAVGGIAEILNQAFLDLGPMCSAPLLTSFSHPGPRCQHPEPRGLVQIQMAPLPLHSLGFWHHCPLLGTCSSLAPIRGSSQLSLDHLWGQRPFGRG